jgi:hypothetical protein
MQIFDNFLKHKNFLSKNVKKSAISLILLQQAYRQDSHPVSGTAPTQPKKLESSLDIPAALLPAKIVE